MPLALLLSPDDQAVSAITAVLEEMSVTCERPLDGVSAAQKLNSSSFDLVLVDCENLPAAKLIFDVCRRGKNGNNPVPIAIVDGRAGLPTAFRLGAELILTKPVAKDQARSTIRTAVSRVKKEEPARTGESPETFSAVSDDSLPNDSIASAATFVVATTSVESQEQAQAATASAASSQLTSFSDPSPFATSSVSEPVMKVAAAAAAIDSEPVVKLPAILKPAVEPAAHQSEELCEDPVLAEIDRAEAEPETKPEAKLEAKSDAPVFSSYPEKPKKEGSRGALVAVFVLILLGAGVYAAWMYQPGFRSLAQPQVDRVLALMGRPVAHPPVPVPATVKPAPQPTPVPVAPTPAADTTTSSTTPALGGPGATAVPATTSNSAVAPAPSSSTSATTLAPNATAPASTPDTAKAGVSKTDSDKVVANQDVSKSTEIASNASAKTNAAGAYDEELPGEKTAIILSSKGAEKRLTHSVQPKYPAGIHPASTEGTMVLKAVIDEDGKVQGARVVEGNSAFAKTAISAVKQWRYRPYMRDGKALPFQTIVLVDFQRQ